MLVPSAFKEIFFYTVYKPTTLTATTSLGIRFFIYSSAKTPFEIVNPAFISRIYGTVRGTPKRQAGIEIKELCEKRASFDSLVG